MSNDPINLATYLEGAYFPATGGELAGVAASNGAPDDLLKQLRSFEGDHFDNANAVVEALGDKRS
jgi:hypothetical protein